ncbi:MAG: DinB family protein [Balneolaceae bacterium]
MQNKTSTETFAITTDQLLAHWQGHRKLTRKVIDAFPEEKLFSYSIGGMRPFADMARELIGVSGMGIHGVATGDWFTHNELNYYSEDSLLSAVKTKEDLFGFWDQVTEAINETWPLIPEGRFHETDKAFGQYEGSIWSHVFYFIENENHHRGQGYVYLRSLGVEPPFFWDRE